MSRVHMLNGNIAEKGKLISHAIMIIGGGLQQGLNLEKGGDMAQRLDGLYEYMTRRVLEGSAQRPGTLDEVDDLLATIEDGLERYQDQVAGSAAPAQVATVA